MVFLGGKAPATAMTKVALNGFSLSLWLHEIGVFWAIVFYFHLNRFFPKIFGKTEDLPLDFEGSWTAFKKLTEEVIKVNSVLLPLRSLTWRWGTPGRWGNPPLHIISHFYLIMST